jgi:hypothetical protein
MQDQRWEAVLGAIGLVAIAGFLAVFMNIPWEWNMFMDDISYNTWMPNIPDLGKAIGDEIAYYWRLGRFYPVKYVANLIKWRFLPNDPYVFRYFNLGVFFLSVSCCAAAVVKACGPRKLSDALPVFVFLIGASFLHKPLLEIISLNPLGETWVCLFFSLGAYCLMGKHWAPRYLLARVCFLLVALAKEPAALVFFASAARYAWLAWCQPSRRREFSIQAALDLACFGFFLVLAFHVMAQGTFTKAAYFSSTPVKQYAMDFIYKVLRYSLWISPFVLAPLFCIKGARGIFSSREPELCGALIFFGVQGCSYLVFMSTQGRVAYQEIPASISLFGFFSLLSLALFWKAQMAAPLRKYGVLLLAMFCLSYFISVSRWERFIRGIVEPTRAVKNLLSYGGKMTILVPVGELQGHIETMIKEAGIEARVIGIDRGLKGRVGELQGKIFVFEFPYYMGDLASLPEVRDMVGGWSSEADAKSYRIYRGNKEFP